MSGVGQFSIWSSCLLHHSAAIRFGAVSRENLVGRTLSGYTLKDLVGEGGTSVVYRAEHPARGSVAFKVLRDKLRHERTAVARFNREAEFGKRVLHPNVIQTIETGVTEGLHFLVMEWAGGDLLERYAKRNAPLRRDEVARIILQVGEAVGAAHASGIIHRDLKPDNAMYDPETGIVKLLDFGIAADTDTRQDERLTRAGYFVGTLMYVAPEALSGELVTPAADQYSLATIAYFLLTGCLPYLAKSPREMFTQLLSQPPIPLNKARPNLEFGPEVEAVVMRALSRQPGDRFPDVLTFAKALNNALLSTPTADEPGLFSKVRSLFRR
jgi:eukaryotic-like serine/threonine-protein kinase